ncbi:Hypothetical protein, putative [Bodo saltans]|uniref:Uncharacterized protein n=1 Tax=Bodo saltans TaxID=75058 RepID=A0A0S4JLY4_BODSA|nr:Hypothetical protein, putative [Bodo saltans]|eukprot:CUG91140.1 Hypothetical protein, putative [Bodo saltans]
MPAAMQTTDTLTMVDLATHAPKRAPPPHNASNPLQSPSKADPWNAAIGNASRTATSQKPTPSRDLTVPVQPRQSSTSPAVTPRANNHHNFTLASSVAESSVLESHHADLFDASSLVAAGPRMTGDTLSSQAQNGNHLWATEYGGFSVQGESSSMHLQIGGQRGPRAHSTGGGLPEPSLDGFFVGRSGSPTSPSRVSDIRDESRLPLFPESTRSAASLKSNLRRSVAASSVWGSMTSDAGNCGVALDLATFRTY